MRVHEDGNRIVIDFESGDAPVLEQAKILLRALSIYAERNPMYKDNWRRFGWRGCLFRLRERTERAWDALWDHTPLNVEQSRVVGRPVEPVLDDLVDLINFAGFTIRAVHAGNRDGSWFNA